MHKQPFGSSLWSVLGCALPCCAFLVFRCRLLNPSILLTLRSPLLFTAARNAYIVETSHFDPLEQYGDRLEPFGFKFDRRRQVRAAHMPGRYSAARALEAG